MPGPAVPQAACTLYALALAVEILRRRFPAFEEIVLSRAGLMLKPGEERSVLAATQMLAGVAIVFVLFPRPIAVLAIAFLALGDPAASAVGRFAGTHRFFGKSLQGTAAFLATSWAAGTVLLATGLEVAWPVMVAGATAAAIIEASPTKLDDNLTVPIGSAIAMLGVFALLG